MFRSWYNAKGVSMSTSVNQILGPCNLSTPFNPKHFPQKWLPLVCLDRLLISTWSVLQDMSTSVIHCISFHVMIVSKSSMTYFQKVDSSLYCQPDFILVKQQFSSRSSITTFWCCFFKSKTLCHHWKPNINPFCFEADQPLTSPL